MSEKIKKFGFYGPNEISPVCYKYIIGEIAKYMNCITYLELGLDLGDTFQYIEPIVDRAIGVDLVDRRIKKVGEFYKMSTTDFFKIFKDKTHIIFIDADHNINAVIDDFEHSIKILNKYGIIFFHDTDPKTKEYTQPHLCNDSYKIIDYIIKKHSMLNVVTLPISESGLTMVMRKKDRRVFNYIKQS